MDEGTSHAAVTSLTKCSGYGRGFPAVGNASIEKLDILTEFKHINHRRKLCVNLELHLIHASTRCHV